MRNQATALQELNSRTPGYAQALLYENIQKPVPVQPPPTPPDRPFRVIFFHFLLPLIGIALAFIIPANSPMWTSSEKTGIFALFFIFAIISFGVGASIADRWERNIPPPPPPPPHHTYYRMTSTSLLWQEANYKDTGILVELDYSYPESTDPRSSFHKVLNIEMTRILRDYLGELKKEDNFDRDELEYRLVQAFGRATYESGIKVFRFNIRVRTGTPGEPLPFTSPRSHAVRVGDIIA